MKNNTSLKDIFISLIESIDQYNYILKNHHKNVAIIAYSIAKQMNLDKESISNLILASAIHDIGALDVKDQDQLTKMDVIFPDKHAIIGSKILSGFKPFDYIAQIIRHHHIYYSDIGMKYSVKEVPEESYILHLADRIDILIDYERPIVPQADHILHEISKRENTIFNPKYVKAFQKIALSDVFWHDINFSSFDSLLNNEVENILEFEVNYENFEKIAIIFSRIVDYRSHYTAAHSVGVGNIAYEISKLYGFDKSENQKLKIAGYLHDIGKIAINSQLIEKPGTLTDLEYEEVKKHAYFTFSILSKIKNFDEITYLASKHHERYDGQGYPFHYKKEDISTKVSILALADIFCALREERPYKAIFQKNHCIKELEKYVPGKLDTNVLEVLIDNFDYLDSKLLDIQKKETKFYLNILN